MFLICSNIRNEVEVAHDRPRSNTLFKITMCRLQKYTNTYAFTTGTTVEDWLNCEYYHFFNYNEVADLQRNVKIGIERVKNNRYMTHV